MTMEPGQKFNRLTAVRFVETKRYPGGGRSKLWEFKCDCGNTTVVPYNLVKRGHTRSCGCYQAQRRIESHTKHGEARKGQKSHLYLVYHNIKARCENPKMKRFADWGGRGIKNLWTSYEQFKADMGPTYKEGLEIERKDNNGHYCKENCRWATVQEQALNRRSNIVLSLYGITLRISQWADLVGINPSTLQNRYHSGWSVEDTLTRPVRGVNGLCEFRRSETP